MEEYGRPAPVSKVAKPAKGGKAAKARAVKRREDWVDIAWALINSTEFLYRH